MAEEQIGVLLVDDHTVVRSGLCAVLSAFDDLKLLGEGENGEQAIALCDSLHPDIILMDLLMPKMDGVAAIKVIKEKWPRVKILALTSFKEKDYVEGALQAGAVSYLLKDISADELVGAIRKAFLGQPSVSPEAAKALIQKVNEPAPPGGDLTEREREILKLMVEGLSNNEMAKRLFVSHSTVKFHVSNILSKLGAASRTEAVALAVKNSLV